ncbi:MAG: MBL fold metallo-hydrolase [Solirubrobacteraceae bacterium]|nr:MBL fold metallo-hydrolase [Solirubrobacteraceae bacterium]
MLDVRMFTVGAIQENSYLVRADEQATEAVFVDPGAEPERLLAALDELGCTLAGILLTHTHFDHVGAVPALAEATGAEVWVPELEYEILLKFDEVMAQRGGMFAQLGPFLPYDAEHTVTGGDVVELGGMTFDVVFTPGHSIGHVVYAPREAAVLLAGDVLFRESIGRTDLPGGDHPRLLQSIAELMERFEPETTVLPGHMGITTLGHEAQHNPFLR